MNRLGRLCCGMLLALLFMPLAATAATDMRMQVHVPKQEGESGQSDLTDLAKRALPVLWDRLIPQAERAKADALPASVGLLSRIVPGDDGALVEFNRQAVFQTLRDAGIDYLASSPQLSLVIHVANSSGTGMPQSETLLRQYAESIAPRWGIELAKTAPSLVLSWRWVDDTRVMFSARGNSRLQEFTETRTLPAGGDPLESLKAWLQQVLLKARDAYVQTAATGAVSQGAMPAGDGQMVWITVTDHAMSLSEQVTLEDALHHDPRVKALIPYSYSREKIRYRLRLTTANGDWLSDWFSQRGFSAEAMSDGGGWLIH
ncbi:MAG TPA: hypothetical protein VJ961_08245 [Mariprofundaceae bacterium]|nr:hypothetical protein [Mariprofundaceae bacterium]